LKSMSLWSFGSPVDGSDDIGRLEKVMA
jgi:hypothetical protein